MDRTQLRLYFTVKALPQSEMLAIPVMSDDRVLLNLPGWLCLQFAGAVVVLYATWKSERGVAKVCRSVLLPIAIGQLAVLLLTASFQIFEVEREPGVRRGGRTETARAE